MSDLDALLWPLERMGDALEILARRAGLAPETSEGLVLPDNISERGALGLDPWMYAMATRLGLESEMVSFSYPEIEQALRRLAPALVALEKDGRLKLVALVKSGDKQLTLLGPSLELERVPVAALARRLRTSVDAQPRQMTAELLAGVGIPEHRRKRAIEALLDQRLAQSQVSAAWILRPDPGKSFYRALVLAGVPRELYALLGAHLVSWLLFVGAWWMIGKGALEGRADTGWLLAWALLLLSTIPVRALETWIQGKMFVRTSRTLKQRLLHGALSLEPDEIRHQGAGQLLARVFESEAVEALALGGGFATVLALIDLVLALVVLGFGARSLLHVLLLAGWCVLALFAARRYYAKLVEWTNERNDLTSKLVERMVGHRTRLAQESREDRHRAEDQELSRYLDRSRILDRFTLGLLVLVPSGWLVLGLAGLAPALLVLRSPAAVAVALGGVLLAHRALGGLANGLGQLATASVAWKRVAPLFDAAARRRPAGDPGIALRLERGNEPVVNVLDVAFRYPRATEPVLRGAKLTMQHGDRILLEGPSGAGKSTLGALIAGLRRPQAGIVLLNGVDFPTLGEAGWRRRVVAAPQFHENHLVTAPLAFNLLMGRRWPPTADDVNEAEAVCRELGLGPVIERMPAGMQQMVGESGWQLSHGERSRLFIARALLQNPDLIVLDESFAALDPETLARALTTVTRRAQSLVVVAHP